MLIWWDSLTLLQRVLACVAAPATLLLIIQTVLLLCGLGGHSDAAMDADSDADFDLDSDGGHDFHIEHDGHDGHEVHDGGLRMFTIRGFIIFFAVLGWGGLALSRSGASGTASIVVGLLLGIFAMVVAALILKWALKLQSDGTTDLRNAVGATANVYIPIPAARREHGKVTCVIQERLTECDAVTDDGSPIKTGSEVVVVGVTGGNTLIVRRKGF